MNQMLLLLLSVFMGSWGQILLKFGADRLGGVSLRLSLIPHEVLRMLRIPEIVMGLFFFGASFLLWMKVLTGSQLSLAYPLVGLGYVNVLLFSSIFFHESLTPQKLLGSLLIVAGVMILHR